MQQPNTNIEGAIGTTLIHALLLLLFFFITYKITDAIPLEESGISVNFGTTDAGGAGQTQPLNDKETLIEITAATPEQLAQKEAPPESVAAPAATKPNENNSQVLTTTDQEAPEIAPKENKNNTQTTPKDKTQQSSNNKTQPEDQKGKETKNNTGTTNTKGTETGNADKTTGKTEPSIDPGLSFKGNKNNASNQGNNNGTGDVGSKMGGADISNNTTGTSQGAGEGGIGYSLNGRRMIVRPNINDNSQEVGIVVITIKVNKAGEVYYAEYTSQGSTTTSNNLVQKSKAAAQKARFNAIEVGPEVQQGTITFKYSLK